MASAEIEVTPEMIKAGQSASRPYLAGMEIAESVGLSGSLIVEMYRAMRTLEPLEILFDVEHDRPVCKRCAR
jgi:hypothetical protein